MTSSMMLSLLLLDAMFGAVAVQVALSFGRGDQAGVYQGGEAADFGAVGDRLYVVHDVSS